MLPLFQVMVPVMSEKAVTKSECFYFNENGKLFVILEETFSKCVLCNCMYSTGLDVHLLKMKMSCSRDNHIQMLLH